MPGLAFSGIEPAGEPAGGPTGGPAGGPTGGPDGGTNPLLDGIEPAAGLDSPLFGGTF